eukprot:m.139429 g.139429  ORF g.139429 m.139429 type:complete len:427 (+) comp14798_c0_seq11:34-1314(+)
MTTRQTMTSHISCNGCGNQIKRDMLPSSQMTVERHFLSCSHAFCAGCLRGLHERGVLVCSLCQKISVVPMARSSQRNSSPSSLTTTPVSENGDEKGSSASIVPNEKCELSEISTVTVPEPKTKIVLATAKTKPNKCSWPELGSALKPATGSSKPFSPAMKKPTFTKTTKLCFDKPFKAPKQSGLKCEECKKDTVVMNCIDCRLSLCEQCMLEIHMRQSYQAHQVSWTNAASETPSFCIKTWLRKRCSGVSHMKTTDEVLKGRAKELKELRDVWKKDRILLQDAYQSFVDNTDVVCAQIRDHFQQLHSALTSREEKLIKDVNKLQSERVTPIVDLLSSIPPMLSTSKNLIRRARINTSDDTLLEEINNELSSQKETRANANPGGLKTLMDSAICFQSSFDSQGIISKSQLEQIGKIATSKKVERDIT